MIWMIWGTPIFRETSIYSTSLGIYIEYYIMNIIYIYVHITINMNKPSHPFIDLPAIDLPKVAIRKSPRPYRLAGLA